MKVPTPDEITESRNKLVLERTRLEAGLRELERKIQLIKQQERGLDRQESYNIAQSYRKEKSLKLQTYQEWSKEDFHRQYEYEKSMRERG